MKNILGAMSKAWKDAPIRKRIDIALFVPVIGGWIYLLNVGSQVPSLLFALATLYFIAFVAETIAMISKLIRPDEENITIHLYMTMMIIAGASISSAGMILPNVASLFVSALLIFAILKLALFLSRTQKNAQKPEADAIDIAADTVTYEYSESFMRGKTSLRFANIFVILLVGWMVALHISQTPTWLINNYTSFILAIGGYSFIHLSLMLSTKLRSFVNTAKRIRNHRYLMVFSWWIVAGIVSTNAAAPMTLYLKWTIVTASSIAAPMVVLMVLATLFSWINKSIPALETKFNAWEQNRHLGGSTA